MPKKDDEKFNFIPMDKDVAEWRKDPEYMEMYKASCAELQREIRVDKARKAVLAWMRGVGVRVRGVWAYLTGGIDGRVL